VWGFRVFINSFKVDMLVRFSALLCTVLLTTTFLTQDAIARRTRTGRINGRITQTANFSTGAKVAEIVAATPDGNTVIFTNAEEKKLGFVSLTNPTSPSLVGNVDLTALGEPTSVAITPNGQYAIVAILRDPQPGLLVFVNVNTRQIVGQVQLRGIGPDSIAIAPDGQRVVVAIEDQEDENNLPGQRPGSVNIVKIDYASPVASRITNIPINLSGVRGVNYPTDPQPEYVAINPKGNLAAVSLQENNAIAIININNARVVRIFSTGASKHLADLTEDGQVSFTENFQGRREPDGIAFTRDGQYIVTANEGDTSLSTFGDGIYSGGRGWSIFNLRGNVVYDSCDTLEKRAASRGFYPDNRSADRGIEVEGTTIASFGNNDTAEGEIAFVIAERGNFIASYDLRNVRSPRLLNLQPTGRSPEGIVAIPQRNLVITANEGDGTLSIFRVR
jgi:DNA-binding beta-propeller fold protein YncE